MERPDVWFSSAGNDPDPEFETRRCFDAMHFIQDLISG